MLLIFNDGSTVLLHWAIIPLSLSLKTMPYCWKCDQSLIYFHCVIYHVLSWDSLLCFCFIATPLCCGFDSIHEHNLLLPRAIKLSWCCSALVHLSPLCPKSVCSQWPISCIVIIASAVQMIFHLPLGTWFSAFCLQVEVPRVEITIETNFDCFVFRLQTYLLDWVLKSVLQNRALNL